MTIAPADHHQRVQEDIAGRFDRLPMSRWQLTVRLAIGVCTFFEAFDQLLIAYALPALTREWQLGPATATLLLTIGSLGMLVGALLSGWLADRVGRVRVIAGCAVITGLTSLAMSAAPGLESFILLRLVQGLAIGGEVPTAAAYVSEISRARSRGRFVLLYEVIFPGGLVFGALAAAWIIPQWGWRTLFLVAAVPSIAAGLVQWRVPESPRWLAARGRHQAADETMTRIERAVVAALGRELPPPVPVIVEAAAPGRSTLRDLFAGRYRRRTIMLWVAWFTGFMVNFGITSWLPSLYHSVFGLSESHALWYATATSVAGLVGCIGAALLIDRWGRRIVLGGGFALTAVTLGVLGLLGGTSAGQVLVWASLAGVCFSAANASLYLFTPELYPTRSRALGCSTGGAWNRLGLICGSLLVGAIYGAGGPPGALFLALAGAAVVGAVTVLAFAEETAGRDLEEISP